MQEERLIEPPRAALLVPDREAARLLSVCVKTLFSLRKAGKLPCVRIGSRVLYDPADLRHFVERQKGVAHE